MLDADPELASRMGSTLRKLIDVLGVESKLGKTRLAEMTAMFESRKAAKDSQERCAEGESRAARSPGAAGSEAASAPFAQSELKDRAMNENSTASTLRRHEKYDRLIAAAKSLQPIATAVAHPCDETSLRGAVEAGEAGLIKPILVGPKDKIAAVAKEFSLDLGGIEIVDVPHSQAAAEKAVELVRTGKADLLMKGSLHTDELLSEVVKRETGLRTGRRISHVFVMDVPAMPRLCSSPTPR